jgi:hypothetical protein
MFQSYRGADGHRHNDEVTAQHGLAGWLARMMTAQTTVEITLSTENKRSAAATAMYGIS